MCVFVCGEGGRGVGHRAVVGTLIFRSLRCLSVNEADKNNHQQKDTFKQRNSGCCLTKMTHEQGF